MPFEGRPWILFDGRDAQAKIALRYGRVRNASQESRQGLRTAGERTERGVLAGA